MKSFYNKSISETLKELKTSNNGLTDEEAAKRLAENGENSLEAKKKTNYFLKFLAQFKDIMVLILIVAAIISLVFALVKGPLSFINLSHVFTFFNDFLCCCHYSIPPYLPAVFFLATVRRGPFLVLAFLLELCPRTGRFFL